MIVSLGGRPIGAARLMVHRFLEATKPEVGQRTPAEAKIERERMRAKVAGTKRARSIVLAVLDDLKKPVLQAVGLREDDAGGTSSSDLASALTAAGTWPEDAFSSALDEIVRELFDQGGESAAIEVGANWKVVPKHSIDAILKDELDLSKTWVRREQLALKAMLTDALESGTPVRELAENIGAFFEDGIHFVTDDGKMGRTLPADSWAEMVARTEVTRAYNAGNVAVYRNVGVDRVKWLTAEDERVCPECEALDGTTAAVGENFEGVDVAYPPLHPSCRCATVAARDDEDAS